MSATQAGSIPGMDYLDLVDDLEAGKIEWDAELELGVRAKFLKVTDDLYAAVEQWDPGFVIPFLDEHQGTEFIYVLRGSVVDENGETRAGGLQAFEKGTSHRPGAGAEGSTTLVFRQLGPGEREGLMAYYQYHPQG